MKQLCQRYHNPCIWLFSATVFLMSGCSTLSGSGDVAAPVDEDRTDIASSRSVLVARDLVSVLSQIPELDPAGPPLVFAMPTSSYGQVLAAELQRAGYDMRLGGDRTNTRYLDYAIAAGDNTARKSYEFRVSIGAVGVKREYALDEDRIFPVSSVYVSGAQPDGVQVNEDLFSGSTLYPVPLRKPLKQTPVEVPAKSLPTPSVQARLDVPAESAAPADSDASPPGLQARTLNKSVSQRRPKTAPELNMYETRQSNFADLLTDYEDVRKEILVFDNDSVLMGTRNRKVTRELVRLFDAETDVFSVIGCSHGKSALRDGNRNLALGRSSRVREELILSGINPGYVLDEGCWSHQHFDEMMPRRGVVLTLKRFKNAG